MKLTCWQFFPKSSLSIISTDRHVLASLYYLTIAIIVSLLDLDCKMSIVCLHLHMNYMQNKQTYPLCRVLLPCCKHLFIPDDLTPACRTHLKELARKSRIDILQNTVI